MCLLPAPTDGVPYPQPLAGPKPQYVPWGVLLVRPIGHPRRPVPPRVTDQRSWRYPTLLRVLRWGRYVHLGAPQTSEVGSLVCVSSGPVSSRPPCRCVVCGGGFPVSPRWDWVVVVGERLLATPSRVACVRVPATPGRGSAPVAAGGPSPLLAEGLGFRSPPLLAGVLWCWWGVGLRHSWLRSADLWGVVPPFRLRVLGGRSLATPG